MSEINLLTTEEKLEQKIKFYTKILNILLALVLLFAAGFGYYFNTLYQPLLTEKNNLDNKINSLKNEIVSFSNEENTLREMKNKYDTAKNFKDSKVLYELVVRQVYERNISGGVIIKTISLDTDKELVSVRVSSDSTSFKRFVDNLKASQVNDASIKNIFLNSGIPEEVNEVSKEYVVTVKYNKGALNAK